MDSLPPIRCDKCKQVKNDVRATPDRKGQPLCNECWVHTKPMTSR